MPPKKSKTAGAAQPVSASQPTTPRPTRASARLRRNSDTSVVSEAPSDQLQPSSQTPATRGRKRKATAQAEPEVIVEEEDEIMPTNDIEAPACDGAAEEQSDIQDHNHAQTHIAKSTRKVHFGPHLEAGEMVEEFTATHITPHPNFKMTVKNRKRRTASPEKSTVKRQRVSRTSLPAALTQDDPVQIIQDMEFAPLRSLIDARIQRLSAGRGDLATNGVGHVLSDDDEDVSMVDDDMAILSQIEEMTIPQLSTLPHTPTTLRLGTSQDEVDGEASDGETSPGAYERAKWNDERKKFADAIIALQKESEEARAQLRVLHIELEAIGFAEEDASSLEILNSIRESFARVREFLETELPGSLPETASNQDLAEILVANVKEFAHRLRTADKEQRDNGQLVKRLHSQINGLVDHVADREMKAGDLQTQLTTYEDSISEKDATIGNLEQSLQNMISEKDGIDKQLGEEIVKGDLLAGENKELDENLARLTESLRKYQDEEKRLTSKINSMEEEHQTTVAAMNKEREQTVRNLNNDLDKEIALRTEADNLANDQKNAIEQLETKIEQTEAARDEIQAELDDKMSEVNAEKQKREAAEANLDEKMGDIGDLEHRVRQLENELDVYEEQVEDLRQLCDSHKSQREAAESELDERNTDVEVLDQKLRESGKAANELRQKLFEVQQQNAAKVKQMELAFSERDLQFQSDIAAEVQRREKADELAQSHAAKIHDLEQQLAALERNMLDTIQAKDEQIQSLKDEVTNKEAELQSLRDQFARDEKSYQTQLQERQRKVTDLEEAEKRFQQMIRILETAAETNASEHTFQLEERDQQIAVLDNQRAALEAQKGLLEGQIKSLERRVSDEAEHLLQLQTEKGAEVDALKKQLRDKQSNIENVEKKVRKAEKYWEESIDAREEQIRALNTANGAQAQAMEAMTKKFSDYVRRSSGFIDDLRNQLDVHKVYVNDAATVVQNEGASLLKELETLAAPVGNVKKTKTRQMPRDSGIEMVQVGASEEEVMISV